MGIVKDGVGRYRQERFGLASAAQDRKGSDYLLFQTTSRGFFHIFWLE